MFSLSRLLVNEPGGVDLVTSIKPYLPAAGTMPNICCLLLETFKNSKCGLCPALGLVHRQSEDRYCHVQETLLSLNPLLKLMSAKEAEDQLQVNFKVNCGKVRAFSA